jgi:CheY-like chemotaxis protein
VIWSRNQIFPLNIILPREWIGWVSPKDDKDSGQRVFSMADPGDMKSGSLYEDPMPNGAGRTVAEEGVSRFRATQVVGRPVDGIVLDFNNALTVILGNLELLRRQENAEAAFIRRVDVIEQSARRIAQLTGRLLSLPASHEGGYARPWRGDAVDGGARAADDADPEPLSGRESILVVDDELELLGLVREMLEGLGYQVLTAVSGQKALEVLESGATVDLVFSDVMMPGGINGFELADLIRSRFPGVKVLLASGHAGAAAGLEGSVGGVLEKPYNDVALTRRIRQLLDESALPEEGA